MIVKFEQHTDIDAPVETVWSIITDAAKWPLWFPGIAQAPNVSAMQSGGTFTWQEGGESGSGSIVHLGDADIQVVTQVDNKQVTHTFTVGRHGGLFGMGGNDTRLNYRMEYDPPGGVLGDFVAGGNPVDTLKVKHTLEKVKQLAESQAGNG